MTQHQCELCLDGELLNVGMTCQGCLHEKKNQNVLTHGKATIYRRSELFGTIVKTEVRNVTVEIGPYAQHSEAYHVRYTKKGARKQRGFVITDRDPYLLVLDGHGHPDPNGLFDGGERTSETTIRAKYHAFDVRYVQDFTNMICDHILKDGARSIYSVSSEEHF